MSKFNELVEIVKKLRGPNGCPWDIAQTHESLTPFAVEEAHELEEAINNKDVDNIKEELGDLLFQSVLHAELARQAGNFDIEDVIEHLNNKMVSRHPHVFGDVEVSGAKEVLDNWEAIKSKEKKSDLFDIPKSFPALVSSQKIGRRSRKIDFDWQTPEQVLGEVTNEFQELKEALKSKDQTHIEEELGDLLFTVAQLARHLDLDAEKALRLSNQKFVKRVRKMQELRPDFDSLTRQEKEALWTEAKKALKK